MNGFIAVATMVLVFGAIIAALAVWALIADRRHPS